MRKAPSPKVPIPAAEPAMPEQNSWDIYTPEGVEDYFDDDELSLEEASFMRGYLTAYS